LKDFQVVFGDTDFVVINRLKTLYNTSIPNRRLAVTMFKVVAKLELAQNFMLYNQWASIGNGGNVMRNNKPS